MSNLKLHCGAECVSDQLARILGCQEFDASDRNRRFLEYIVTETLAGRADRIKAYSIATGVFGRGDDFDPQQDAIVRIEAGRMRRSLEHFYLTAGRNDPVLISIPVGSYVPSFSMASQGNATPGDAASTADPGTDRHAVRRPSVFVAQFSEEGDLPAFAGFSEGFARHVVVGLTRFSDLVVLGFESVARTVGRPDIAELHAQLGIDYVLTGGAVLSEGHLTIEALLIDAQTGHYIWSEVLERQVDASGLIDARTAMADQVVRALAQPSGLIYSRKASEAGRQDTAHPDAFGSVMRFHQYSRTFDRDQFESVRLDLEQAVATDPTYSEAFACLSQMYSNSVRFGHGGIADPLQPLQRALALAHRAIQLSPASSRAYLALASAYWFSGEVRSAMDALETSRSLNPNDMEVLAELGLRRALRCEWEQGIPLLQQAYGCHPGLQGTFRIGLSLWHYVHGRYDEALAEARKTNAPGVIYPMILIAISAAKLERHSEAEAALRRISALDPDYGRRIAEDLENRNVHPELVGLIVRGMRQAGMKCSLHKAGSARPVGSAVRAQGGGR